MHRALSMEEGEERRAYMCSTYMRSAGGYISGFVCVCGKVDARNQRKVRGSVLVFALVSLKVT